MQWGNFKSESHNKTVVWNYFPQKMPQHSTCWCSWCPFATVHHCLDMKIGLELLIELQCNCQIFSNKCTDLLICTKVPRLLMIRKINHWSILTLYYSWKSVTNWVPRHVELLAAPTDYIITCHKHVGWGKKTDNFV